MTMWDFLAQAGFWEWTGFLLLAFVFLALVNTVSKCFVAVVFSIFRRDGNLRID